MQAKEVRLWLNSGPRTGPLATVMRRYNILRHGFAYSQLLTGSYDIWVLVLVFTAGAR
jgi:hypothetical protein